MSVAAASHATTESPQCAIDGLPETHTSEQAQRTAKQASIYGSFLVGHAEFALSVSSVQEVVNVPDAYSAVPLAPDYLLGLFNLRGAIVPVVDMRRIFKIAESMDEADSTANEQRKIAIIEHGSLCLGLLFDRTCEVFNSQDKEYCQFSNRSGEIQQAVVEGVFKMDDGRRIVQVLDVQALLKLDSVPHGDSSGSKVSSAERRGPRRQCISFTIGDASCALNIDAIKEIVNIGAIMNTVLAGDLCLGAIDIRGNTVPIINFSRLLGYPTIAANALQESDAHRVIVMKVDDHMFGLLVASIDSIISYFDDELIPFPVLGNKKTAMFTGCVAKGNNAKHTIVLKHDEILSNAEIAQVTKGHSQLFSDKDAAKIHSRKKKLDRKTLLTFSLGSRYGIEISEVREVIEMPEQLVQTPNLPPHILGMANLRGELVAVINPRIMYKLEEADSSATEKVLVFESGGHKHGLIVDSVDSILPFNSSDSANIPRLAQSGADSSIGEDVKNAIMLSNQDQHETICILDLAAVSRRAASGQI